MRNLLPQMVLLLLILLSRENHAQNSSIEFREMSPKGGFTFGAIHQIKEDGNGFIWMATHHGLLRFDSEKTEKFIHNPNNPNSIPSNYITSIDRGTDNRMWFSSDNGVFCYNQEKEIFERHSFVDNAGVRLPTNTSKLITSHKEKLWTINNNILYSIDLITKNYQPVFPHPNDSVVNFISKDNENRLWVKSGKNNIYWSKPPYNKFFYFGKVSDGAILSINYMQNKLWIAYERNGAECYDQEGNLLVKYGQTNQAETNIKSNRVRKIIEDGHKNIWFATYNGLAIQHPDGSISHFDSNNSSGIKHSSIYDIYVDSKKGIWIGTWSGALSYLNPYDNMFVHINKSNGLSNSVVSSITESKGRIWIGTEAGGVNSYKTQSGIIEKHKLNPDLEFEQNIKVIRFDKHGGFWVGTFNDGLWWTNKFDRNGIPLTPTKIMDGSIYDIKFDSTHVWVASYFSGLHKIELKSTYDSTSSASITTPHKLSTPYLRTLFLDSRNQIWLGTHNGIFLGKQNSDEFTEIICGPAEKESQPANHVYCIFEDKQHAIWAGTSWGLFQFNPQQNTFNSFEFDKTFSVNEVYGINEDDQGKLWLSTDNGLVQFNPDNGFTRQFTEEDGLQANQFNPGAVFKSQQGTMYFGGTNGISIFDPNNIKTNTEVPQPIVVGILINNELQHPSSSESILKESILSTQEISLNHNQNSITFQFVANNFLSPKKNLFSYRLLNYNNEWNTGSFRSASFTKIPPGNYQFELKAANNDGVWNNTPTVIMVHVNHPWWQKWYAFLAYITIGIFAAYYFHKEKRTKQELLNRIYLEKIKSQHDTELNNSKLSFFTNISHEIKTPLSLITSPLEHLINLKKEDPELIDLLKVIERNTIRLKHMLHQIIDITCIEANQLMSVKRTHKTDAILKEVLEYFILEAKEREIELSCCTNGGSFETMLDLDKIEKVFFNLLTNAFKYVNDGGSIQVSMCLTQQKGEPLIGKSSDQKMIEISIFNSNSFIPENAFKAVFQRFFQLQTYKKQGTGIGLHMVKEYVLLHNGQIDIKSIQDVGTTFIIRLPKTTNSKEQSTKTTALINSTLSTTVDNKNTLEVTKINNNPIILIVDDNSDLRLLLRKILSHKYSIATASNGKAALEQLGIIHPDLVISDVLMPEMDGIELCRHIKTKPDTMHIPVILLTALDGEESQISGYETGADSYLTKPFSEKLLLSQIQNLLDKRKKTQETLLLSSSMNEALALGNAHLGFLGQVEAIVVKNLLDPGFSVEALADKLKISRTSLHRKLKHQTGQSTTEFIRYIRLKSAVKMLKTENYTLSEIAYNTGFGSPSYFSTTFKKQFGITPKEYCENLNNQKNNIINT